jgi:hypothetical protein
LKLGCPQASASTFYILHVFVAHTVCTCAVLRVYICERIGTSGFVFHIAVKRDPGTHTYPVGVMTKLKCKIMAYVTAWHALYAPQILLLPKGNKSDLVTYMWKC